MGIIFKERNGNIMYNNLRRLLFFCNPVLFLICLYFVNLPLYGQDDSDSQIRRLINRVSNITPGRIHSEENKVKILDWREQFLDNTLDYNTPIVVMTYPRIDPNNAFTFTNSIADIINAGNQLLYFEVSNQNDLSLVLLMLSIKIPENQRISLVIGGHGTYNRILLGGISSYSHFEGGANPVETHINNLSFFYSMRHLNITTLVLESCSTGDGESYRHNLANAFSNHTEGMIFAPTRVVDARSIRYFFDEDGHITEVLFGNGIEDTFSIRGNYIRQ